MDDRNGAGGVWPGRKFRPRYDRPYRDVQYVCYRLSDPSAGVSFQVACYNASIDQADLPDAIMPVHSVSLGIAPAGTPEQGVTFDTPTSLANGNFSGALALPVGYAVWARACLGATCGPAVSWPPPAQLISVVSSKVHGSAGTFDVDLPLSGNPGVECRSGGANDDYTLIFKFAAILTNVGSASVTSGTGTVSSSSIDSNDAHQYNRESHRGFQRTISHRHVSKR